MTELPTNPETGTRPAFLEKVETLLKKGGDVAVAADFDENISRPGPSNGRDPRDSQVDPIMRQAMRDVLDTGRDVVIVSSRGARDVARIAGLPGLSVVGTLGWETLDKEGNSHIHPQFRPFKRQITGILREVRERFLREHLHRKRAFIAKPNTELVAADGGVIILQSKGYNEEYPEGINATWALSMLDDEVKQTYRNALEQYYNEAFTNYAEPLSEEERATLQELCGFMIRAGQTAEGVPTFDVEIRPTSQGAKALAVEELMKRSDDPTRLESFTGMPSHAVWIFSGDHIEQDFPVMQLEGVMGVWSKSPHDRGKPVPEGVAIVVDSVSGNAALTTEIASLMARYPNAV